MAERIVWVTGATGYLGAGFIRYLMLRKINCRVLDFRNSSYENLSFNKSDLIFHFGDPSSNDEVVNNEAELKRQDLIIQDFLEVTQIQSFYVSSALVYGLRSRCNFKIGDETKPFNSYTAMKVRREKVFAAKGAKVLRVSNVYGGANDSKSLIIRVINHYLKGAPFSFIKSNGTRDFIFVQDVYDAFFCCMESTQDSRQLLNIGTGRGSSVSEVKRIVEKELALSSTKTLGIKFPMAFGDRNVLDVSVDCVPKGWRPRTPLYFGISMEILDRRGYAK